MGVLSSMLGRIRSRTLVQYRADPEAVARLLPARFRPAVHRGHALIGVCHTRMDEPRGGWTPLAHLTMGTDLLTWRIPAVVERSGRDGEAERNAVWIPRRDTSSWFGANCTGRLTRGRWRLSRFELDESPGGVTLVVERDGERELELRAEACGELRGSVLHDLGEARHVLGAQGEARPTFALAPGFDELDLDPEHWDVEALEVREALARPFAELLPAGSFEIDCALRLTVTASHRLPATAAASAAARPEWSEVEPIARPGTATLIPGV